jgi:cation transport regulator ChaB
MQIPGNEENALVVDTDALPDRYHDALMTLIDSNEGQQETHLYKLMSRRILPDMGVDMMNAMFMNNLFRSVPVDNITMYPAPNNPCPLRTIVDYINNEDQPEEVRSQLANRVLENQKADATQGQHDIAQNILRQAEDLEAEASRKRESAYKLVPELRPDSQVTASPEVTEASGNATEASVNAEANSDNGRATLTLQAPSEGDQGVDIVGNISIQGQVDDLPADVRAALDAAHMEIKQAMLEQNSTYDLVASSGDEASGAPLSPVGSYDFVPSDTEVEGNEVDTSDAAIEDFLARVALREDMADKELWLASQPKNPVGRPRKDGSPAGSKEPPAPPPAKKRGRPPKAK